MAVVSKFGKTTPCMRDTGSMIRPMAEADSSTAMEMSMKVSGKTIRHMAKECIPKVMVRAIQASGLKIYNMASALRSGQMALLTRGIVIYMKNAR